MPSILLIEDEPILGRSISRAMSSDAKRVHTVTRVQAAQSALLTLRFDLILTDIVLPDGDALDLLVQHRARLHGVPLVVITGQDSPDNRGRAEALGAAAFVPKPFALGRLRELVVALLAEAQAQHAPRLESAGPKVLMYSHDTIGLGHMRRNHTIARELVARVPGLSVLMLVGCPAGMMFEPSPGIDFIKLPSLYKVGRDSYHGHSLRLDAEAMTALRGAIIRQTAESFRPDLFLVDHEPTGAQGELRSTLDLLHARGETEVVLGLRDILDEPARITERWQRKATGRRIAERYDHVLIYGCESFFPSSTAYGLEFLKPGEVSYCGLVTPAKTARRKDPGGESAARRRRVLVAGGGGRDAYPLIQAALRAQALLPARARPAMTVLTGPLMDEELRRAVFCRAMGLGVACHTSVTDMPDLLSRTDLFITMAGYNSVTEALATGCPILTVPRVGPSSEQRMRAQRLEELGLARVLWREKMTPARLARLMLEPPTPARAEPSLSFDGATRAADILTARLSDRLARRQRSQPQKIEELQHAVPD